MKKAVGGRLESGWVRTIAQAKELNEEFKLLIHSERGHQMRIALKASLEVHKPNWIYLILQGCRASVACRTPATTANKIRGINEWNIFESVIAQRFGKFNSSEISMYYQTYNHHIDLHVPSVQHTKYYLPSPVVPTIVGTADYTVPLAGGALTTDAEDAEDPILSAGGALTTDAEDAEETAEEAEEMRQLFEPEASPLEKTMRAVNVLLIAALFTLSYSK